MVDLFEEGGRGVDGLGVIRDLVDLEGPPGKEEEGVEGEVEGLGVEGASE